MAQMGRPGLSSQQKHELWAQWKAGRSLSDIGRNLGRRAGSIFGVLRLKGGIAHRSEGDRDGLCLCMSGKRYREDWLPACHCGRLRRSSAVHPQRSAAKSDGKYRAANADDRAWRSAIRPKPCRLALNPSLQMVVTQKLNDNWSPQQISGWLKAEYANDDPMRVSHETIYKSLFVQARGVLRKELISRLRTGRLMRRGKASTTRGQPRGQIVDAISIKERPAEIEDRAIPGHWEGDLLSGGKNSHIATLVERQSRFVVLVQVPGKDTESVVNALVRQVKSLPAGLMSTLTWDRGTELYNPKRRHSTIGYLSPMEFERKAGLA